MGLRVIKHVVQMTKMRLKQMSILSKRLKSKKCLPKTTLLNSRHWSLSFVTMKAQCSPKATTTNHALILNLGHICHSNNIYTCSRHCNVHQNNYYRHITCVFVRKIFQRKEEVCSKREFSRCDDSGLCGGYLYANILAKDIVILNNRSQWGFRGEKIT